jgi:hypothetical protein
MSEAERKPLLRLLMTPLGIPFTVLGLEFGRLSYKAHIRAMSVPLTYQLFSSGNI